MDTQRSAMSDATAPTTPQQDTPQIPTLTEWMSQAPPAADPLDTYRGYSKFAKTQLLKQGGFSQETADELDAALIEHAANAGHDLGEDPVAAFRGTPADPDLDAIERHAIETNDNFAGDAAREYKALLNPTLRASYDDKAEYEQKLEDARLNYQAAATLDKRNAANKAALNRGDTPFAVFTGADEDGNPTQRLDISPTLAAGLDDKKLAEIFEANPQLDHNLIEPVRAKLRVPDGFDKPAFMLDRQQDFSAAFSSLLDTDKTLAADASDITKAIANADAAGGRLSPRELNESVSANALDRLSRALDNTPLAQEFTKQERTDYLKDYLVRMTAPAVDHDDLDANFQKLSTGEYHVPMGLMLNKSLFDKAVSESKVIPEAQKALLAETRESRVSAIAPSSFKVIAAKRPEFLNFFQKRKDAGESNAEILDAWMGDPENHSSTMDYLKGTGESILEGFGGLILYPLAGLGSKAALDALAGLQKSDSDRRAYAQLFGANLGAGYDLARLIAPIAADVLTVFGVGAAVKGGLRATAGTGLRAALKGTLEGALTSETKGVLKDFTLKAATRDLVEGSVARAAATGNRIAGKAALDAVKAEAGGVVNVLAANSPDVVLKMAGNDIARQISKTSMTASYLATAFNRSAGSTYIQLYSTLSEQKDATGAPKYTPEQVREIALGHGLLAGTITAAVTGGFSFMGKAGLEQVFNQGVTRTQMSSVLTKIKSDGPLRAYLKAEGVDLATVDTFMDTAVKRGVRSLWQVAKAGALEEAPEEGLDQFLNYFHQQQATGDKINLGDAVTQAGYAAFLGGVMGAGVPGIKAAFAGKLDANEEAAARRGLLFDAAAMADRRSQLLKHANKLDTANLPQTARVLRDAAINGVPDTVPASTASPAGQAGPAAAPAGVAPATGPATGPDSADAQADVPEGVGTSWVEQAPSGPAVAAGAEAGAAVTPPAEPAVTLAPEAEATTQDSGGTVTLPSIIGSITGKPLATADPEAVQEMQDAEGVAAPLAGSPEAKAMMDADNQRRNDLLHANLRAKGFKLVDGEWKHPDYPNANWASSEVPNPKKADVQRELEAIQKEREQQTTPQESTQSIEIGQMVKLKKQVVGRKVSIAGRVTNIMADGKVEVRTQQDGYHVVPASEITPFPPQPDTTPETNPPTAPLTRDSVNLTHGGVKSGESTLAPVFSTVGQVVGSIDSKILRLGIEDIELGQGNFFDGKWKVYPFVGIKIKGQPDKVWRFTSTKEAERFYDWANNMGDVWTQNFQPDTTPDMNPPAAPSAPTGTTVSAETGADTKQLWQKTKDEVKKETEEQLSKVALERDKRMLSERAKFEKDRTNLTKKRTANYRRITRLNPEDDTSKIDSASKRIVEKLVAENESISKKLYDLAPPDPSKIFSEVAKEFGYDQSRNALVEHRIAVQRAVSEGLSVPPEVLAGVNLENKVRTVGIGAQEPTLPPASLDRAINPDPAADVADALTSDSALTEARIIEDPAAMPAVEDVLGRVGVITEGLDPGDAAFLLNVVGEVPKVESVAGTSEIPADDTGKIIARMEPVPRVDVDYGTRYKEFRVRKVSEDEANKSEHISYGYKRWVVETRLTKTDETAGTREEGEWQAYALGESRQKAIEDAMVDRDFVAATSLDPTHTKLAEKTKAESAWRLSKAERLKAAEQEERTSHSKRDVLKDEANRKYNIALKRAKLVTSEEQAANPKKFEALKAKLLAEHKPAFDAANTRAAEATEARKVIEGEMFSPPTTEIASTGINQEFPPAPGTRVSFSHPSVGGVATGVVLDEPAPAGKIKVQVYGKKVKLNVAADSPVVGEPLTPDKPKPKTPDKVSDSRAVRQYPKLETRFEKTKTGWELKEARTGAVIGRGKTKPEAVGEAERTLLWQQGWNDNYLSVYERVDDLIKRDGLDAVPYGIKDTYKPTRDEMLALLKKRKADTEQKIEDEIKRSRQVGAMPGDGVKFDRDFIARIDSRIAELESSPPPDKPKHQPSRNPAIDKSSVTAELNAHNFKSGTTAFLKSVAAKGPKHQQAVARLLLEFPELLAATPVTLVHLPKAAFAGALIPSTGQVLVNTAMSGPRGAVDTLLHELLHAATVQSIKNPTPAQAKILARLERVRQSVAKRAKGDPMLEYATGSLDEFVTHFFTSPQFQQQVAALTPKGQKNWVQVILDTIRELLGAKRKSAADTALEGVMNDMILFTRDAAARYGKPKSAGGMQPVADTRFAVTVDGQVLTDRTALLLPAHHGTPHKVDKFSTEKIGTGEGAQAFGFGLYFASDRGIAEFYQKALSADPNGSSTPTYQGSNSNVWRDANGMPEQGDVLFVLGLMEQQKMTAADALAYAKEDPDFTSDLREEDFKAPGQGNIYTVDILADESELLDWDKPLSEQPDNVKKVLNDLGFTSDEVEVDSPLSFETTYKRDASGGEILRKIVASRGMRAQYEPNANSGRGQWRIFNADGKDIGTDVDIPEADGPQAAIANHLSYGDLGNFNQTAERDASKLLDSLGIKGIRFLDGNSRADGTGNHNYVIFNESNIRITHENGKPVTPEVAVAPDPGPYGTPRAEQLLMLPGTPAPDGGASIRDTVRFHELTAGIEETPEGIEAFKAERPEAYAELERMRAEVLRGQGYTLSAEHWTNSDAFNVFDKGREGTGQSLGNWQIQGFWFNNAEGTKSPFGSRKIAAMLKFENPKVYRYAESYVKDLERFDRSQGLTDKIKTDGYDGVVINPSKEWMGSVEWDYTNYVALSPEQVKSASPLNLDPTTGKLIPPNQWGDAGSNDIRFLPGTGAAGEKITRFTHRDGRGLLDRSAWDLSRLSEDEEMDLPELLDYGMEQPRDVPAGHKFYFTEEGLVKHKRLLKLIAKASRSGGLKKEVTVLRSTPSWESVDGQVAVDPVAQEQNIRLLPEATAQPDFSSSASVRDAALGFIPENVNPDDLSIDYDELAGWVEGHHPANAEDIIRSTVNRALSHKAGMDALGADATPEDARRFANTLDRIATGNTAQSDIDFYRSNPSVLARLVRYLTAALKSAWARLSLRWDARTAVMVDRMTRTLGRAENGFGNREVREVAGARMLPAAQNEVETRFNQEVQKYVTGNWPADATERQAELRRFTDDFLRPASRIATIENEWTDGHEMPPGINRSERGAGAGVRLRGVDEIVIFVGKNNVRSIAEDTEFSGLSEFEAKKALAVMLHEEVDHAAYLESVKRKVGIGGDINARVTSELKSMISEIQRNAAEPVNRALYASMAVYDPRVPVIDTIPDIAGTLDKLDIQDQHTMMQEFMRQVLQLRRQGVITESVLQKMSRVVGEWFKARVRDIRAVMDNLGIISPTLDKTVRDMEVILSEIESDIRFLPAATPAGTAPTTPSTQLTAFTEIRQGEAGKQGKPGEAGPRKEGGNLPVSLWDKIVIAVTRPSDLTKSAQVIASAKRNVQTAAVQQVGSLGTMGKRLLDKVDPAERERVDHLIDLAAGSNRPLLTADEDARITRIAVDATEDANAEAQAAKDAARDTYASEYGKAKRRADNERLALADDPAVQGRAELKAQDAVVKRLADTKDALILLRDNAITSINDNLNDRLRDIRENEREMVNQSKFDEAHRIRQAQDNAVAELNATHPAIGDWITKFRTAVNELQTKLMDDPNTPENLKDVIGRSIGSYLVRSYEIHKRPGFGEAIRLNPEYADTRNALIGLFDSRLVEREMTILRGSTDEFKALAPGVVTPELEAAAGEARVAREYRRIANKPEFAGVPEDDVRKVAEENVAEQAQILFEEFILGHEGAKKSGVGMSEIRIEFERYMKKTDLPQEIRDALGEITDPILNLTHTYTSVANLLATQRALAEYKDAAIAGGWIISTEEKNSGNRKYDGWKELVSKDVNSPAYAPLAGWYASPEQKAAFDARFKSAPKDLENSAEGILNGVMNFAYGAAGTSLGVVTLGNPAKYMRDVLGGYIMAAAQGALPFSAGSRSVITTWQAAFGGKAGAEQEAYALKLISLGVLNNGVHIGMLKDAFAKMRENPKGFLDALQEVTAKGSTRMAELIGKGRENSREFVEMLGKLSQFTESIGNISVYERELSVLRQAKWVDTEAALEQEAARRTRMVMPSKDQSSQLVTEWTKTPLGLVLAPFIRFKAEMIRTVFNTYKLAWQDARSDNPAMKAHGLKRFASAGVVHGGLTMGLSLIMQAVKGISDDEDRAIRAAMPIYAKNSSFIYLPRPGGGLTTLDFTYLNPFSFTFDPFTQASKAIFNGRFEDLPKIAARFVGTEFFGENITASAVMDVSRNVDANTNMPIYLDTDTQGDKIYKAISHVIGGAYNPAILKKPAQAITAMSRPAKDGDPFFYTPVGILTTLVTPVKPRDYKIEDLAYRAMSNLRKANAQLWMYTAPLMSPAPLDPDNVEGIYRQRMDATRRINRQMWELAQGYEKLGMSRAAIMRKAEDAGFSRDKVGKVILRGVMDRPVLNDDSFAKMLKIDPARATAWQKAVDKYPPLIQVSY